jgi:exonuclease III
MKLMLILEAEDIDILCLQETWIAEGTAPPNLEGFNLIESRRTGCSRGGLAIYVRKPLQIEST